MPPQLFFINLYDGPSLVNYGILPRRVCEYLKVNQTLRFSNTAFYINTLSSILGIDLVTFLIFKFGSQIYITFHPKLRRWICLFSSCIFISLSGWVFNRLQCSSFGIFIQLIHRLKRFLW